MEKSAISDIVNRFNDLQGRLRVSVTHTCQLRCKFCHQEGIENHWKAVHIDPDFFVKIADAYSNLGGRYIELTGGEPTLHPKIDQLIDSIAKNGRFIILCTNGLRLDRLKDQVGKIGLIKLSLHATDSSDSVKHLLGNAWDFKQISRNIEKVLQSGVRIQLIFTHTAQNTHHLESVLDVALSWGTELQVVDLIASRRKRPDLELGYIGGDESCSIVSKKATLVRTVSDRTGAVLKVYKTPAGKLWEVKDYHYGLLHSRMCDNCRVRNICGEGIYAMRVDANGIVKPCLLREDLQDKITEHNTRMIEQIFENMLQKMLEGNLQWTQ